MLGQAVGKDKFATDAKEALSAMVETEDKLDADDIQRDYIKQASERICQTLKRDFAPFLPALLPRIYKTLVLDGGALPAGATANEDAEYAHVTTGDGKVVSVHSSKFEEIVSSVQLLNTFATELEGAFFDFVPPTAEALLPLLS